MRSHKTPTQIVWTVAAFENYGLKGVWIKSRSEGEEIHLSSDEMDRKALKKVTSEWVLEECLLFWEAEENVKIILRRASNVSAAKEEGGWINIY